MPAGEVLETGVIRLTMLVDDGPDADSAAAYWENTFDKRGDLIFTRLLREIVEDEAIRKHQARTAEHFARFATAEIAGIACRTCGNEVAPVPVEGRMQAREVWKAHKYPALGRNRTCGSCVGRLEHWIRDYDHGLPEEQSAESLLTALALKESAAFAPSMNGNELVNELGLDDTVTLVRSFLVPQSASHDAVDFENGERFYPSRIIWRFAGEGSNGARKQQFADFLDGHAGRLRTSGNFATVAAAAARAIQDEALNYFDWSLSERRMVKLDDQQQAVICQLVADNWGALNLGHF